MNPIVKHNWTAEDLARWGIRSIDEFTVEELASLRQKVELWTRQHPPHSERTRHRSWGMPKRRPANPV